MRCASHTSAGTVTLADSWSRDIYKSHLRRKCAIQGMVLILMLLFCSCVYVCLVLCVCAHAHKYVYIHAGEYTFV